MGGRGYHFIRLQIIRNHLQTQINDNTPYNICIQYHTIYIYIYIYMYIYFLNSNTSPTEEGIGLGCGLAFRVQGSKFRFGFRVSGFGFRLG